MQISCWLHCMHGVGLVETCTRLEMLRYTIVCCLTTIVVQARARGSKYSGNTSCASTKQILSSCRKYEKKQRGWHGFMFPNLTCIMSYRKLWWLFPLVYVQISCEGIIVKHQSVILRDQPFDAIVHQVRFLPSQFLLTKDVFHGYA